MQELIENLIMSATLHEHYNWLQKPAVVASVYQGQPANRHIYPIFMESHLEILFGVLIFWADFGLARVIIHSKGGIYKEYEYNTHSILIKIERYIQKQTAIQ